jgi:hypothetical protein
MDFANRIHVSQAEGAKEFIRQARDGDSGPSAKLLSSTKRPKLSVQALY